MSKMDDRRPDSSLEPADDSIGTPRRVFLKKLGRYAAVTPPAVTLILAAATKPAQALPSGGGSSKQLKTVAGGVDGAAVLSAVTSLRRGPSAENFQKSFGVGNGRTIDSIDAIGVCLAAIKALAIKVETLERTRRSPSSRVPQ